MKNKMPHQPFTYETLMKGARTLVSDNKKAKKDFKKQFKLSEKQNHVVREEKYEESQLREDPFTIKADFTDHEISDDQIQSIFYPWGLIKDITKKDGFVFATFDSPVTCKKILAEKPFKYLPEDLELRDKGLQELAVYQAMFVVDQNKEV